MQVYSVIVCNVVIVPGNSNAFIVKLSKIMGLFVS